MSLVRHQYARTCTTSTGGQVQPRTPPMGFCRPADTEFKESRTPSLLRSSARHQLTARHSVSAHTLWYADAVFFSPNILIQCRGIVNVAGDHTHGSPGRAGGPSGPHFGRQVLEQETASRRLLVLPRCDDSIRKINFLSHLGRLNVAGDGLTPCRSVSER